MAKREISGAVEPSSVADLIPRIKRLAREYRARTGRPLGVTGEIAEYEACRALGLQLSPVRQNGYDATRRLGGRVQKLQIKGRVIFAGANRSQRVSTIKLQYKWDAAILVELDETLEPIAMYEATRKKLEAALSAPGSKARNERGQLGLSKFRACAKLVWSREMDGHTPPRSPRGTSRQARQSRRTAIAKS